MVTLTHKPQAAITRVSKLRILTRSVSIRDTSQTGVLRWVGDRSARVDGILSAWDRVRWHDTIAQIQFQKVRN